MNSIFRAFPSGRFEEGSFLRKTNVDASANIPYDFWQPTFNTPADIFRANLQRWYNVSYDPSNGLWIDDAGKFNTVSVGANPILTSIAGKTAVGFGGTNALDAGGNDTFATDAGRFTIFLIFKYTPGNDVAFQALFAKTYNSYGYGAQGAWVLPLTGAVGGYVGNGGAGVASGTGYDDSQPHRLILTYNLGTLSGWVDGVSIGTSSTLPGSGAVPNDPTDALAIGAGVPVGGAFVAYGMIGTLAQVGATDMAATADQVAALDYYLNHWILGTDYLAGVSNGVASQSGTLQGAGGLNGVSNGVAGQSGTLQGAGALNGVSNGVAGQSGTLLVPAGALIGQSDAVAGQSGTLQGTGALNGVANGVAGQSGTLQGAGALNAVSNGVAGQSGTLQGAGALNAISNGVAGQSGNLKGAGALNAVSNGVAGQSGALQGAGALNAVSNGVAGQSGNLKGAGALNAVSNGVAGQSGTLQGAGALNAVSNAIAGQSGTLQSGTTAISNAVAGQSGTLQGAGALNAIANGVAGQSGTLQGAGALNAIANGVAGQSGTLQGVGALNAIANGVAGQSGTLQGAGALNAIANGVAGQSGTLQGTAFMTAVSNGIAGQSGNLQGTAALNAVANGVAGQSGTLTALGSGAIAGTSNAIAGQVGALIAAAALAGRSDVIAGQRGTLQSGSVVQPLGFQKGGGGGRNAHVAPNAMSDETWAFLDAVEELEKRVAWEFGKGIRYSKKPTLNEVAQKIVFEYGQKPLFDGEDSETKTAVKTRIRQLPKTNKPSAKPSVKPNTPIKKPPVTSTFGIEKYDWHIKTQTAIQVSILGILMWQLLKLRK